MRHRPEKWNGLKVPYGEPVALLLKQAQSAAATKNWSAILALADNDSDESIKGLVSLYKSKEVWLRRSVVFAIGENVNGVSAANIIHKALEENSFPIVYAGVEAAAKLRLFDTNEKIVQLLKGGDVIQKAALSALKDIWLPTNFSPVFHVFLKTKNDGNKKEAAWTLRAKADNNCWEKLVEVWQYDKIPRHRIWACELMAIYGCISSIETLSKLEQDKDGHVRFAASKAIKKISE